MTFYSSITEAYDEIFPLNKVQVDFIHGIYPVLSAKNILDAGCGTGSLSIELGRRGAAVKAFDLDNDMVQKAIEKCPQAINVGFSTNDLLKFSVDYKPQSFDVVCCFGNTLAHLSGIEEIELFLREVKTVLKPGGTLVFQVVNYDRILNDRIDHLPTIESDRYIFERRYSFLDNNVIDFSTVLKDKVNLQVFEQSVALFPIQIQSLKHSLKADFGDVKFFGNFKREAWTINSFHTIVEARLNLRE